jgi:DNA-binding NarL/FixJ family response regulator
LVALLEREPDITVVGEAADGETGLEAVGALQPDVAVVDHGLPGISGVEVCESVTRMHPGVAVVMLTTFLSDEVVRGALDAGARAYVCKDVVGADLKRAIRSVAAGNVVLDPQIAARVARWATRGGAPALTGRECEVLRLVAHGARNHEIAQALSLSENTVRTYLRRMMAKLECHSRSELATVATRRGLL